LTADAKLLDPAIPAGVTNATVISKQLERMTPNNATATVNGLAEAAAYFRGDPVEHHDYNEKTSWHHRPDKWQGGKYSGGNAWTAVPASYLPRDAFDFDDPTSDNYGWCNRYKDEDGVIVNDQCEDLDTFDCVEKDGGTTTVGIYVDGVKVGEKEKTVSARTSCKHYTYEKWTKPNYESPLKNACQSNFIVLISDGTPTAISEKETLKTVLKAAGVPDGKVNKCFDLNTTIFATSDDTDHEGNCGPELLNYLATTDINPEIPGSNVKTYTVGFALEGPGKAYLKHLAEKGQGEFKEATKPEELAKALNEVFDSILAGSQNFAELSIDVDRATFSHDNKTYFSLFSPSSTNAWNGNLKGYFLKKDGLFDIKDDPATFDDGSGVRFADNAQSFWSSVEDGNDVMLGGASESISELPPAPNTRKMYSNLASTSLSLDADNIIEADNGLIDLGVDAATQTEALNWLSNAPMGDPLHTKPMAVKYASGDIKKVVYVMTNQGFIHAFDATDPDVPNAADPKEEGGEELYAFMPKELLQNIPALHKPETDAPHIYGLDGAITRWHDDVDNDGIVDPGDNVMLIFGMRRGGSSYYALDVTQPNHPVLKWQISSDTPNFEKLAQTWSRASLVTAQSTGKPNDQERVLLFGGGYDAQAVDDQTERTMSKGNAIYAVDRNGNWLWTVDDTTRPGIGFNYSIASDLTVIDSDLNGDADRIYVGDVAGQMWRVDFTEIRDPSSITLSKLIDIDDLANPNDYQPIFYPPSISMVKNRGQRFFAVSFGTGDRTQPLVEETHNALYMVKDYNIEQGAPEATTTPYTSIDLYDATSNDAGSNDEDFAIAAKQAMKEKHGWKVSLGAGEKALSKVVTFEGKFMATTFEPQSAVDDEGNEDACGFATLGRLYMMDIVSARPIKILEDGSETYADPESGSHYLSAR